jgi:hypothetical protein
MPAVGAHPHAASAGVGKPAMHEVVAGGAPICSGLYGDLMGIGGAVYGWPRAESTYGRCCVSRILWTS